MLPLLLVITIHILCTQVLAIMDQHTLLRVRDPKVYHRPASIFTTIANEHDSDATYQSQLSAEEAKSALMELISGYNEGPGFRIMMEGSFSLSFSSFSFQNSLSYDYNMIQYDQNFLASNADNVDTKDDNDNIDHNNNDSSNVDPDNGENNDNHVDDNQALLGNDETDEETKDGSVISLPPNDEENASNSDEVIISEEGVLGNTNINPTTAVSTQESNNEQQRNDSNSSTTGGSGPGGLLSSRGGLIALILIIGVGTLILGTTLFAVFYKLGFFESGNSEEAFSLGSGLV